MILRRISVERYGCFDSAVFEFRRGLNLVSGGNESGKSLLLFALPAALLGIEHGSRMRSWGDSLSCRVTLQFEGPAAAVRLARDLESNLVRLEESVADGTWREVFAGKIPPGSAGEGRAAYYGHLERLLGIGDEALLRALLNARDSDGILTVDGRLANGLVPAASGELRPGGAGEPAAADDPRQEEISRLEAELTKDRDEYRKGEEYLAWIRKRWQVGEKPAAPPAGKTPAKSAASKVSALERQREQLSTELARLGIPVRLPADLPELFERAEALRQELAALQLEATPLQRRRQGVAMPGFATPLIASLTGIAVPGAAYLFKTPFLWPLAGGCALAVLLIWSVFLVRYNRARKVRDSLDAGLQEVEARRSDALSRQQALAERFESYGLPSAPVEMVKLQQLYRRNEELIRSYQDVCARLGTEAAVPLAGHEATAADHHLRPEDLPEAERRLAELGEGIRRREQRLAALRSGKAVLPAEVLAGSVPVNWSEQDLLKSVGQHLERLTGGSCRDLRLEEGQLRLELAPGRWAAPVACSRGTFDCLVLAVRLALAQLCGGRLPLTVDELPSALDVRRRQNLLRALERHAVNHQTILASCDEELARRVAREHWSIINLKPRSARQTEADQEASDGGQLHLL